MHDHPHAHEHDHHHEHPQGEDAVKQTLALLRYMLEHNRQHTEELHNLFHALDDDGCYDAADELETAMRYYTAGNDALENALDLAKSELPSSGE